VSRCAAFSRDIQSFLLAAAWNWNTAQDMDPSNFCSFLLVCFGPYVFIASVPCSGVYSCQPRLWFPTCGFQVVPTWWHSRSVFHFVLASTYVVVHLYLGQRSAYLTALETIVVLGPFFIYHFWCQLYCRSTIIRGLFKIQDGFIPHTIYNELFFLTSVFLHFESLQQLTSVQNTNVSVSVSRLHLYPILPLDLPPSLDCRWLCCSPQSLNWNTMFACSLRTHFQLMLDGYLETLALFQKLRDFPPMFHTSCIVKEPRKTWQKDCEHVHAPSPPTVVTCSLG
jgi:hypothetical protein